jgi:hypothetical protein
MERHRADHISTLTAAVAAEIPSSNIQAPEKLQLLNFQNMVNALSLNIEIWNWSLLRSLSAGNGGCR